MASSSATFEFNSNEAGSFVCSLNGVAASCGSPKQYTGLSPGDYTFTVRALDTAGNADASPAVRTWTVDTVAPETTLSASGPTGSTTATSAEFTFSSEPGVTFRCQLDSQAIEVGCTSPRGYWGSAVGDHTFKVWATDGAGNADPTHAARTWTVTGADTGTGQGPDTGTGGGPGTGNVPPPAGGETPVPPRPWRCSAVHQAAPRPHAEAWLCELGRDDRGRDPTCGRPLPGQADRDGPSAWSGPRAG